MKLLSASQIRELDKATIANEPVSSLDLMERAAGACAQWIQENCTKDSFLIFCGTGNNGGDGLAIARLLSGSGKKCAVLIVGNPKEASKDFKSNLERLKLADVTVSVWSESNALLKALSSDTVIVDAIFGTGLNRPVEARVAGLIRDINVLPNLKLCIDIPSGLPADFDAPFIGEAVKADYTLTFHLLKTSFLFEKTGKYAGKVIVLDIGLDRQAHEILGGDWNMAEMADIKHLLPKGSAFDHKGTNGTVAIIAGKEEMPGAVILAARGALHSGVGLVHVFTASVCGFDPEVILHSGAFQPADFPKVKAFGIGPGLGTEKPAIECVDRCLDITDIPSVWDADALNIIAAQGWQNRLKSGVILTPHPTEFDRLFGSSSDDLERFYLLRKKAEKMGLNIVLKGAYTRIASADGQVWFNSTGNAAMAKGGMGDVLTGLINGLLAKGMKPIDSALAGVYLHGMAGDSVADVHGPEGVTASAVAAALPKSFLKVRQA